MILFALLFLFAGFALATLGLLGAAAYVFTIVAFWLALVVEVAERCGPSLRSVVLVALAQLAGFVLLVFLLVEWGPR